jgi:hypothetical protein
MLQIEQRKCCKQPDWYEAHWTVCKCLRAYSFCQVLGTTVHRCMHMQCPDCFGGVLASASGSMQMPVASLWRYPLVDDLSGPDTARQWLFYMCNSDFFQTFDVIMMSKIAFKLYSIPSGRNAGFLCTYTCMACCLSLLAFQHLQPICKPVRQSSAPEMCMCFFVSNHLLNIALTNRIKRQL